MEKINETNFNHLLDAQIENMQNAIVKVGENIEKFVQREYSDYLLKAFFEQSRQFFKTAGVQNPKKIIFQIIQVMIEQNPSSELKHFQYELEKLNKQIEGSQEYGNYS